MADVSPAQNAQEVVLYDVQGSTVGTPERPLSVVTAAGATGIALESTLAATNTSLGGDGGVAPAAGTGVRGWLRSIYDRLADGTQRVRVDSIPEVEVRNDVGVPLATQDALRAGAHYSQAVRMAGSGRLALTLSGNVRAALLNPATLDGGAANTASLRVHKVDWYTSTNGFGSVLLNVTGNLPTGRRPKVNPRTLAAGTASDTADPAVVLADTNSLAFTGGTDSGIVLPLVTDFGSTYELPFTLAPGQNLALSAAYGKGVDSTVIFYWSVV